MGQPRPLFVYFRSFQTQHYRKNYRLQRDSNSDLRSRRQARWPLDHHHDPKIINFCSPFSTTLTTPPSTPSTKWTRRPSLQSSSSRTRKRRRKRKRRRTSRTKAATTFETTATAKTTSTKTSRRRSTITTSGTRSAKLFALADGSTN